MTRCSCWGLGRSRLACAVARAAGSQQRVDLFLDVRRARQLAGLLAPRRRQAVALAPAPNVWLRADCRNARTAFGLRPAPGGSRRPDEEAVAADARARGPAAFSLPLLIYSVASRELQSRHNRLYWSLSPVPGRGCRGCVVRPLADGAAFSETRARPTSTCGSSDAPSHVERRTAAGIPESEVVWLGLSPPLLGIHRAAPCCNDLSIGAVLGRDLQSPARRQRWLAFSLMMCYNAHPTPVCCSPTRWPCSGLPARPPVGEQQAGRVAGPHVAATAPCGQLTQCRGSGARG